MAFDNPRKAGKANNANKGHKKRVRDDREPRSTQTPAAEREHQVFFYEQGQNRRWLHARWRDGSNNGMEKEERRQLYAWFRHETPASQKAPPSKRQGMKLWRSTEQHLAELDAEREAARLPASLAQEDSEGSNDVTRVKDWFVTPGAEKELLSSMRKLKMAKPTGQSSKAQAKTKVYLLEKKMRELNLTEEEAAKQIGWQDHEAWELEKDARSIKMTMEQFARQFRGGKEVEGDEEEDGSAMESGDGEMEEGNETGDAWEVEEEGRLQVQEAAMRNVPLEFE